MKLASLNKGRDGKLVVVSRDLARCVTATGIAPTLQAALDNWVSTRTQLLELYDHLNASNSLGEPFDQAAVLSPLPRAFQWLDGSAYVNHVELVRKARGVEMPNSFWHDPLMYQGCSDSFLRPQGPIRLPADDSWGIDFEGEVAVVVDDVPMGVSRADALQHIKLVMLVNDVSLRGLIPDELAKGFGFVQSKPASAFSPAAVTPDELGTNFKDGVLSLPLDVVYNGEAFGCANAGIDMTFDFGTLIEHAAKSRDLCAGTIIGSGTVSNKLEGGPGKAVKDGGVGYSCIAELRMIEAIEQGVPHTPFMAAGDHISIDMRYPEGGSIFGEISQRVEIVSLS